jgi:hypothetical protein
MLAAESLGLPDEVANRVAQFFKNNIAWLMASMPDNIPNKNSEAIAIQTALQGAMIVAVSLREYSVMDSIIQRLAERPQ